MKILRGKRESFAVPKYLESSAMSRVDDVYVCKKAEQSPTRRTALII